MKKSKAILALAMAFLMFAFSGCSKENKEKENTAPVSSGDYSLIKSVTTYNMDVQTGEWVAASKTEFQYENNYPVSMDFDDYNAEAQSKKKFEYSFTSDLKPISMKQYNEKGEIEKTVDYTEGKISDIYDYSDGGMHTQRTMLQYGNNDDYFTLLVSSSKFTPNDTESVSFTMEEVDSISVITENGLLKKTTNTGVYANWNEGETKEWMRFNGTYTANYDEDGILNNTSAVFRAGPPGGSDIFQVTKKDGKITEVVSGIKYEENKDVNLQNKFEFEYYDDLKIDAARYAAMINAIIIGNENNYYKYFWY